MDISLVVILPLVILQHKQKILTSSESMQCLALPELVLDLVSVLLVF